MDSGDGTNFIPNLSETSHELINKLICYYTQKFPDQIIEVKSNNEKTCLTKRCYDDFTNEFPSYKNDELEGFEDKLPEKKLKNNCFHQLILHPISKIRQKQINCTANSLFILDEIGN